MNNNTDTISSYFSVYNGLVSAVANNRNDFLSLTSVCLLFCCQTEMKSKMAEARFQEEKLRLQQKHDSNVQKVNIASIDPTAVFFSLFFSKFMYRHDMLTHIKLGPYS